jgi:superfamily I DNA and RNA helicase
MNDILTDVDTELDVIFGEYKDQDAVTTFVGAVRAAGIHGTLYIGYPVLTVDDEKIEFDSVLVSRDRGVIIFDLYSLVANQHDGLSDTVIEKQEKLYAALYNRLNSFSELRSGRRLAIEITTATIHPIADKLDRDGENQIIGISRLSELPQVNKELWPNDDQLSHLNAAIQRISNLKPRKKRLNVTEADSKGALIREIEKKVANLDLWQKRGSIEYVNGPQRIRGLAGSGKTVVLALKAAYLHVKRPDWNIVVTFNTRSLYQQFETLITRFVFAQISDEPDWSKLHIMHAWGGSDRTGVYKEYVNATGHGYRDFGVAARLFGYDDAFKGACDEALSGTKDVELDLYDMMLIDEAQDLPSSFFKMAFRMIKGPKRIVWAYDDLQNLGDVQLPSARDLFGLGPNGKAKVELINEDDRPQQDIVLPRCYRNPPWTLLTAHGLGFGVHRTPMAQMFTDPSIWKRLGYTSKDGVIEFDRDVSISRTQESIPSFFGELLTPADTLKVRKFDTKEEQYGWVANEIKTLISTDELEHSDILLILPNVRTSKSDGVKILNALINAGLQGHIPGQTSSRDEIFREGSIAITHIYRAKGNEAPVVFVLDTDFCESSFGIKQRRNILFTAMTRSRAWTYILGVGTDMDQIISELDTIQKNEFALDFHYPTKADTVALAVSTDEMYEDDVFEDFDDLRLAIKKAKGNWNQLPLDLRRELEKLNGND